MRPRPPTEDTARVIAVALAFFGTFAVLGFVEGVFARLSTPTLAALAAFAAGYALLAVAADARLRAFLRGLLPRPRVRKGAEKSPARRPAAT